MFKVFGKTATFAFLCLTILLTSCASQRKIVNGVEEREANEIIVFLQNKGIRATKTPAVEGGAGGGRGQVPMFDITVGESDATEAMALLNIAGLPRRRGQSLLGIFAGGGLVPSQLEEKIRFQQGLAEQISSTIRKIDGVLDADVLLSFPEEDPLNPEKKTDPVSASVYVKHSGVIDDPNVNLVSKIRRLVASSIPGLQFDNVTVIGDRARYTELLPGSSTKKEQKLVNVWTVLVAEQSVTRFQMLFFSFVVFSILLLLLLSWLIWKTINVIRGNGGFKALFFMTPFPYVAPLEEAKEEEEEKEGAEKKKEDEEEEEMGT